MSGFLQLFLESLALFLLKSLGLEYEKRGTVQSKRVDPYRFLLSLNFSPPWIDLKESVTLSRLDPLSDDASRYEFGSIEDMEKTTKGS